MAFANYLNMFPNLAESFPLTKNRTTYEQTLPLNLSILGFDKSLLHASTNLRDFIESYAKDKEIFDLKERHVSYNIKYQQKSSFQIITSWISSCLPPQ